MPPGDSYDGVAGAIARQARERGWAKPRIFRNRGRREDGPTLALALGRQEYDAIFYLSAPAGLPLLAETLGSGSRPNLFLSGMMTGLALFDLPRSFDGGVFVAYPTRPGDRTPSGIKALADMHRRHGILARHLGIQSTAYAAVQVLAEGLNRSGKSLSRRGFVAALERLYRLRTGLTPAISFGPNRRVGAPGAYVFAVDLAKRTFRSQGRWIGLD